MTQFKEIPSDLKVYFNGRFVEWKDATVHVMTHALHYGSAVFEGIRCYKTPKGPAVFRLKEHVDRLYNSAKMYRMLPNISREEFTKAILETIKLNNFDECYALPIIFRGTGAFGVNPLDNSIEYAICCWKWGKYLGEEALEKGVSVQVSSWNRIAPNTLPALAKCAANSTTRSAASSSSARWCRSRRPCSRPSRARARDPTRSSAGSPSPASGSLQSTCSAASR